MKELDVLVERDTYNEYKCLSKQVLLVYKKKNFLERFYHYVKPLLISFL